MAKVKEKRKKPQKVAKREKVEQIRFGRTNYLLLLGGLLSIVFGYLTLSWGSITVAPILLVLGYCVLIPFGIVAR